MLKKCYYPNLPSSAVGVFPFICYLHVSRETRKKDNTGWLGLRRILAKDQHKND